MPRTGMEVIRKQALIGAAIAEIHASGSLNVTVGQIARRAGVSSALAHHYFGGKDDLIIATMRHLLRELGRSAIANLRGRQEPRTRLSAVIATNFASDQFDAGIIAAWLNFYLLAASSPAAARLLAIYTRRLNSNLLYALRQVVDGRDAERIARGMGALIDGVYLRQALSNQMPDAQEAIQIVEDYLDHELAAVRI